MTALTDLTDKLVKAFNSGDVDALADCYAVDATQQHPFFPAGNQGRDAIRQSEGGIFAAFSDIDWQPQRCVEGDDWGAIEATVSATNTSDMPLPDGNVLPATNKRITIPIAMFVRLDDDGVIAEEHRYLDVAGMMGQLGLMG
jgi:steroid delta-isomerase-like uncharacterized protein